jgi:7-cyano-7-deazaguanine synthase
VTPEQEQAVLDKKYDAVAIFSGGLDSTSLVYDMIQNMWTPLLVSFDYGQRHRKELTFARATAMKLGLKHEIVDLTGLTRLISNSALTSTHESANGPIIGVPEGHYAEDNMKATVVPNRNMIMLSIAAGIAVNIGANAIGTGVHAGDHFIYPDCRPDFIEAASRTIEIGNEGFARFNAGLNDDAIYAPFLHASKLAIAGRAIQLGIPFEDTWSCYKGGTIHCGKCGTCVERIEAIEGAIEQSGAAIKDLTPYEDHEYWKGAITRGPVA